MCKVLKITCESSMFKCHYKSRRWKIDKLRSYNTKTDDGLNFRKKNFDIDKFHIPIYHINRNWSGDVLVFYINILKHTLIILFLVKSFVNLVFSSNCFSSLSNHTFQRWLQITFLGYWIKTSQNAIMFLRILYTCTQNIWLRGKLVILHGTISRL